MTFMAVDFELDVGTVEEMIAHTQVVLRSANLMRFLDDEAAPWFRKRADKRFGSEGDDASGHWLPLAETTVAIRDAGRRSGRWSVSGEHPINVRTKDMLNFLHRGAIDYSVGPESATMYFPGRPGNSDLLDKLRTAQQGKADPKTPARPVIAANERDLRAVMIRLGIWVGRQTSISFTSSGTGGGP